MDLQKELQDFKKSNMNKIKELKIKNNQNQLNFNITFILVSKSETDPKAQIVSILIIIA